MKRVLSFAWRGLLRDLRAGELHALALALVVASGAVSTVGFFTGRVQAALIGQAAEVLAADLIIESSRAVPAAWREAARSAGLSVVRTVSLRSVAQSVERTQLVELKAAETGYPLRGALRTSLRLGDPGSETDGLPPPGSAWIDPRLLALLDLEIGDTLTLGTAEFTVAALLTFEPDRGMNLFSIGPRVLIGWQDLAATGLVMPASRVHHHLLLAGEAHSLERYRTEIEPQLGSDYELQGVEQARPELRGALDRAAAFLNLAALASVLLAGIAVAMAAHRYAARHADAAAVLRCLGASRRFVLAVHAGELLGLALLAAALGCLSGYAAQAVIGTLLAELLGGPLPPPGALPALIGALVALATLLGFALPPLLRLGQVSPLCVLRRDLGLPPFSGLMVYGSGTLVTLALMFWLSGDALLTGWVFVGVLGTLLVLTAAAALLVLGLGALRRHSGLAWRFGVVNLARRARSSVAQLLAFGLALTVLLLLTVVRADLLDAWQRSIPREAPNLFLVNIQPDEVEALREYTTQLTGQAPILYPMVRGRLVMRNGVTVASDDYREPRARRLVAREFNLSWTARVPVGNRISDGAWWDAGPPYAALASVEQGLAETLGIAVGDRLRFRIAAQEIEVTVSNLREVAWDSFQVNFFVVLPPGVIDTLPATWITSFRLPPDREGGALASLVRRFPSVTAIDVQALLGHVQRIIDRVTLAVESVFVFTLLAGLAVLFAAIHATLDARRHEAALLRTLGARRRRLLAGLAVEFTGLGLLAGLLAACAASAVGWVLAREVFDLPYQVGLWPWLLGPVGGAVLVGLAGLAGTWRVVEQPPLTVLRRP